MQSLKNRAAIINKIRKFFATQNVLEVQTPMLQNYPLSDVYIDSVLVKINGKNKFLHTSPELEMKKLLANGLGDIYQICPVFRDNEQGSNNFNEFTLLEYYRLGFDIFQLMDNIIELLKILGVKHKNLRLTYAQVFFEYADIDILNTDFNALKKIAKTHKLSTDFEHIEDLQMLLFVHLIEPKLARLPLVFIYAFPQSQSALARIEAAVAQRFELYINGVEIANGYDELRRGNSYQQRFEAEISKRKKLGKTPVNLDADFIENLQNPLPQCSGVAIGIERLLSQI
ncbi:MAG: EF-P lysine aminoacylase GenX [Candidatus Thioglobus sp.]|nr:EF-P lysine aminoacylase GenX [Candidatus Thioglobus sp.]